MSESGLHKTRIRTEAKARADRAAADRRGWFGIGKGASSYFLIGRPDTGRNVALACSEEDRATILMIARSHDAMVAGLAPFAVAGFTLRDGGVFGEQEDTAIAGVIGGITFTVGDFRRAAAAFDLARGDQP